MTTVVVGSGSMMAQALRRHPAAADWRYLSHREALRDDEWTRDAACVINLAFDPLLKTEPYHPDRDVDLRLARLLADRSARYVMASTRMAYGPPGADGRLSEERAAAPVNLYGVAKLTAEKAVAALLGERATILRLSNIFDRSEGLGERRSFFAMALRRLRTENQIAFDMSPFVERDFLPADLLTVWLVRIARQPMPGLFNLGAGFAVPTGCIAQWLIAGYGQGELRITDFREHDGFWLDMAKSRRAWGLASATEEDVRSACIAIGAQARSGP
jgi:UDP-glucose 4-epimerase